VSRVPDHAQLGDSQASQKLKLHAANKYKNLTSLAVVVAEIFQGGVKFENVSRPIGGQSGITRLVLHVANSCTKFEV